MVSSEEEMKVLPEGEKLQEYITSECPVWWGVWKLGGRVLEGVGGGEGWRYLRAKLATQPHTGIPPPPSLLVCPGSRE